MFEKLDKIIATEKDMAKIFEWNNKNRDNLESVGMPLNEGIFIAEQFVDTFEGIEVNDVFRQGIYFKINENVFKIKLYDMSDYVEMLSFEVEVSDGKIEYKNIESYLMRKMSKQRLNETMKIAVSTLLDVFAYMTNAKSEIAEKTEERSIIKKSSSKNKKNKNKIVKIQTKKYIFINEDNEDYEKRGYTRQSDAWSVRGHWRFYKNTGKKVWIKPYVKGDREKVESKEYRL